ncbi:MAG: hypothetical protein ACLFT9_06305 [Coleofasciculus sp.]
MKQSNKSKLPKQVAPVKRPSTSGVISNTNGVEASLASNLFDLLSLYS